MIAVEQFWFEASLVLVPAAIIIAFLKSRHRANVRRNRQLGIALKSMENHQKAVDTLLSDPATPDSLRWSMAVFSKVVSDPKMGSELAGFVLGERRAPSGPRPVYMDSFKDDVRQLVQTRPDLVSAFKDATLNGLIVAMLRDPFMAKRFDESIADIATNDQKKFEAVRDSGVFASLLPNGLAPAGQAAHC